jgi:hypothetical protein
MADTNNKNTQRSAEFSAQLLLAINSKNHQQLVALLSNQSTHELWLVSKNVNDNTISLHGESTMARLHDQLDPILHHSEKIKDIIQENALRFQLPQSLAIYHQQAARRGADPNHMGLLVIQAIALAIAHMLHIDQQQQMHIRLRQAHEKHQHKLQSAGDDIASQENSAIAIQQAYRQQQKQLKQEKLSTLIKQIKTNQAKLTEQQQQLLQLCQSLNKIHQDISTQLNHIHNHQQAIYEIITSQVNPQMLLANANNPLAQWLTRTCQEHSWRTKKVQAALGELLTHELQAQLPHCSSAAQVLVACKHSLANVHHALLISSQQATSHDFNSWQENAQIALNDRQHNVASDDELALWNDVEILSADTCREIAEHGQAIAAASDKANSAITESIRLQNMLGMLQTEETAIDHMDIGILDLSDIQIDASDSNGAINLSQPPGSDNNLQP